MHNQENLRICLIGASGRMGREIIESAGRAEKLGLGSASVDCGFVGADDSLCNTVLPGVSNPLCSDCKESDFTAVNVIIDFSTPSGTKRALKMAFDRRIPLVVGTTGLDASLDAEFRRVSEVVPVVRAGNMSVGVNVTGQLVEQAARMFGGVVDVEVIETHHRYKQDAPSGTARMLLDAVSSGQKQGLDGRLLYGRSPESSARKKGEIAVHALRGGDVVGEHTVVFYSEGERVEITHRATDRRIFADGAVRAARWAFRQKLLGKCGLYSMKDVLG